MDRLITALAAHEHFRKNTINMIASENLASPLVRAMMASDLAHRYSDELYGGSTRAREIIQICEDVVKKLFNANHALITPLSGNLAVLSAVLGLTKIGETVAKVSGEDGGYPLNLDAFKRKGLKLEFDHAARTVSMAASKGAILGETPALIMLGQSVFTHPHPVKEMRELIDTNSLKCPLVYDGSHVLGLIAGKKFQDPLNEGADALLGSTHKTFFGPQGGLLVSNNRSVFRKIARFGGFTQGSHVLVDNMHLHRVAALAVAGLEMIEFGEAYASQVVENSNTLARRFNENGIPVLGAGANGFTRSHQVLLDYPLQDAYKIKERLESIGIVTDGMLRFGTSEVTRIGMEGPEMAQVADIISACIKEERSHELLARDVKELKGRFQATRYSFEYSDFPSLKELINEFLPS